MAKLFTYVIIAAGLIILFNAAGLHTLGSVIMEKFGVNFLGIQNFGTLVLAQTFLVLGLGALISAGIIMGTIGRGNPELFVTAFYAAPLIGLIGDLTSIIIFGGTGWVGYLMFIIIAPLLAGYVISLYDWVRGRDG